jgi:putative flippase GtrA
MNKASSTFTAYFPAFFQLFRFGMIGFTAAAIHFITVVMLVQNYTLAPLIANVVGFFVSFPMSYWGHRLWTFNETAVLHRVAVSKLLLVQLINFAMNEILFFLFLSMHFSYPVALIIVLAILPIFTFIASKWWVFK